MSPSKSKHSPLSLQEKGWSYRAAAKALGVDFSHLHRVLTGERQSVSLLRRAQALPQRSIRKP